MVSKLKLCGRPEGTREGLGGKVYSIRGLHRGWSYGRLNLASPRGKGPRRKGGFGGGDGRKMSLRGVRRSGEAGHRHWGPIDYTERECRGKNKKLQSLYIQLGIMPIKAAIIVFVHVVLL